MNKKNVLFISHSSDLYGAEKSLLLLLKNINREIFKPIIILPNAGPLYEIIEKYNIKAYEVKLSWWVKSNDKKHTIYSFLRFIKKLMNELLSFYKLLKIIKKEKINLIYTNTIVVGSGSIAAKILKVPHIWHIREIINHNSNITPIFERKFLFKFIKRFSDKIIVNSKATAEQFDIIGESKKKFCIVYNAIDLRDFKLKKNEHRSNKGIYEFDWLVAVVGSIQPIKRQVDAIQSIKLAKRIIPNIKLLVIGGDGDCKYINKLKEIIKKENLIENVLFMGYRDDVPNILLRCKALLVPSWNESFGRAVIEGMAACIPVIAVNSGGPKEIITNEIDGFLVPPQKPKIISKKIIELYNSPSMGKTIGHNARKTVEKRFNVNLYVRNIEKIMIEVINK